MAEVVKVRPIREADLPLLLSWRNAPAIRQFMFDSHEISLDEHLAWFARVSADVGRRLLMAEWGDVPSGFVQFSGVDWGGVSEWGFYARPDAARGTGRALGVAALEHAFLELGLHKVCGEVLASNHASIRMHQRLGFRNEGLLRDQHRSGTDYISVLRFGLLRSEWPEVKAALTTETTDQQGQR